jgi:hypothetical protein
MEFGQAYCRYLLKRILRKFILYFLDFYTKCYKILKFILFSVIYLIGNRKWKRLNSTMGRIGPRPCNRRTAHDAQAYGAGTTLWAWSPRPVWLRRRGEVFASSSSGEGGNPLGMVVMAWNQGGSGAMERRTSSP